MAQKLGEELKYETESAPSEEPEFLKAFKAQGVWKVRAAGLLAKTPAPVTDIADRCALAFADRGYCR